jgi:hypothetical protein
MALKHVLAELTVIVLAQRAFARNNALNFAHDVPRALIFARGQFRLVRFESLEFDRAQ